MINQPKVFTWVFLGILAAICGSLVQLLGGVAWLAAGVFAAGAVLTCINWIAQQLARRVEEYQLAVSMSERVRILQEVGKLTVDQVRLLEEQSPVVTILGGSPAPIYALKVGEVEIPFQFINEFLDRGRGDSLCPISTWGEGTKYREYARKLSDYLTILGFCEPARGNQAARWIDQARALQWMGITEQRTI